MQLSNIQSLYVYTASLFADGNRACKRAALEGGIEFHDVKRVLLQFSCTVRPLLEALSKLG